MGPDGPPPGDMAGRVIWDQTDGAPGGPMVPPPGVILQWVNQGQWTVDQADQGDMGPDVGSGWLAIQYGMIWDLRHSGKDQIHYLEMLDQQVDPPPGDMPPGRSNG